MNLRRNLLVSMALLTAITAPALAQKNEPVKLPLTQMRPTELMQILAGMNDSILISGSIQTISPNDDKRYLLVEGTPEGVNRLREIIRLLDVSQKTLKLEARILLQNPTEGASKPMPAKVATAIMEIENNRLSDVVLVGQGRVFRFQMTPHMNGDGTVTLFTRFADARVTSQVSGSYHSFGRNTANTRRIKVGGPEIIAGFAVGNEPPVNAIVTKDSPRAETPTQVNAPMFLLEVVLTKTDGAKPEGKQPATALPKPQRQTVK